MIRRRCITTSPVSTAFLSSDTGASRHVVSFIDEVDHRSHAPSVSTHDQLHPFTSRVLVHSFVGLFEVEAQLNLERECVVSAAMSEYGVLACRVRSLPPGKGSVVDLERAADSVEKVLFFSGRQRLAEVTLKNEVGRANLTSARFNVNRGCSPMQCVYAAELRAYLAVFLLSSDTLCACAPQACTEQRMRFEDRTIACMGVGREGEPEVTIVLDDNTVALCGMRAWVPPSSEPTAEVAGGGLPRSPIQFAILKTGSLSGLAGIPQSAPIRVLWSGRQYMWVVYEDGHIGAFSCQDTDVKGITERSGEQDDVSASEDIEFTLLYIGKLACLNDVSMPIEDLFVVSESRVLSLSYCYIQQNESLVHYGSIQLRCHVDGDGIGQTYPTKKSYTISSGETVYGLHVEGGRYHVLTQTSRGNSNLYISTLPLVECEPAQEIPLYREIAQALEDDLGEHCHTCEARIAAICQANAKTFRDTEATTSMLGQLTELQYCVYALLRREQFSTNQKLSLKHSYPQRILRQLSHAFMQVSVNLFLSRLDVLHDIEQPLHESLGLHTARAVSVDAEKAFMEIVNTSFPSLFTSVPSKLECWPSRGLLCVDVILEYLGYSSQISLMDILRETTEMLPMVALLVLYYSYRNSLCSEDSNSGEVSLVTPERQRHANALREEFLISHCRLPASLNTWAFACYAVDHGINPLAKSHFGTPLYILGPHVCHLSSPPVLTLLPALMNGLLNVAAVDAAYQQIAVILGHFNPASLPPPLLLKLSFVALKTNAHHTLEAIYRANRSPVNEDISVRALALAALQLGDVTPLRGLIRVGSAEEQTVEGVLCTWRDITQRNWLRLCFYILMRRYADALHVCRDLITQDVVVKQPIQVISSHLRSLMPGGNAEYMSEHLQHSGPMSSLNLHINEEGKTHEFGRLDDVAGKKGNLLTCMSIAPTSLENQEGELDAQVRCAMMRCTSHSNRQVSRFPDLLTSSHSNVSAEAALRPSTILSSLDRNGNNLFTVPNNDNKLEIDKEDEEDTISENDKCAVSFSTTQSQHSKDWQVTREHIPQQQKQNIHNNDSASEIFETSSHGFNDVELCESRLQRSGKMCSRVRPCPYHDRKR
ncbi:unnamed protein product [Phytomonas sp. Hart1]|nr:unnamed protein product [Phytomonas sp. Hart1]|eukprot:CCW67742.1 unnamed protein product [Phytomonas sp. isolate Hart1]